MHFFLINRIQKNLFQPIDYPKVFFYPFKKIIMKANKKKNGNVPEWAVFFNEEQYNSFTLSIDDYFITNNIPYEIHGEEGNIESNLLKEAKSSCTLRKVAKKCFNSMHLYWKPIIAKYFQKVKDILEFEKIFRVNSTNFSFAKPFLSVRLHHLDTNINPEEIFHLYSYIQPADIYAELIFDFPYHKRESQREN